MLVNHEIGPTVGVARAHGSAGTFVSALTVDWRTLEVMGAQDLGQRLHLYDKAAGVWVEGAAALARLCSADLAAPSAFYDEATGLGTQARILLNGEEAGAEGRALAWVAPGAGRGDVWELPALGRFSIENLLASPNSGERTVVIGNDDAAGGQLYLYVGEKRGAGNDVEKAGLADGQLYGVKADFLAEASDGQRQEGGFGVADLGDVSPRSGAELQEYSAAFGVTGWLRPEDGAWDTADRNRYYFATTNAFDAPSRLWALDFFDVKHPEWGGTYRMLLDGTERQKMLDNITVTADGTVVALEGVGNNPRAGKVWGYDPRTDSLTELARHDAARFGDGTAPPTQPFTQDEESSGVLDVTELFPRAPGQKVFLIDTQAHYAYGAAGSVDRQEIVEGGQLMPMYVDGHAPPAAGDQPFA